MGKKRGKYNITKVTMQEVAKESGVSQTTVSFIINNRFAHRIPDSTREKVLEACRKLNYRVSHHARTLALGQSNTIGILYDETSEDLINDPYYSNVFSGIVRGNFELNYSIILSTKEEKSLNLPTILEDKAVDGIIYVNGKNKFYKDYLYQYNIPHVIIDPEINFKKSITIKSDDLEGGRIVGNIFKNAQADHIYFVGGKKSSSKTMSQKFQDRLAGFQKELKKHKINLPKDNILIPDFDLSRKKKFAILYMSSTGENIMKSIINNGEPPYYIFAADDLIALGMYNIIKKYNYKFGKDIHITGYNNTILSKTTMPALTTVEPGKQELGIRAVKELYKILKKDFIKTTKKSKEIVVSPTISIRKSIDKKLFN